MKFIVLSDLHVHGSNKPENKNLVFICKKLIEQYKRKKPLIIICGDITDDGEEIQYRNAVEILKILMNEGFRILCVPGNHDYGRMGMFYNEISKYLFTQYIHGYILSDPDTGKDNINIRNIYPFEYEYDNNLFIGLDSVTGNEFEIFHFASGEIGLLQRKKLKKILTDPEYSEMKKIVFFHHHPFNREMMMKMDDADKVMDLLKNKVDVLCFGHNHQKEIWKNKNEIDLIIASGKTTETDKNNSFCFYEVTINKKITEVKEVFLMNE